MHCSRSGSKTAEDGRKLTGARSASIEAAKCTERDHAELETA